MIRNTFYIGELRKGENHGKGKLYHSHGGTYDGEWKKGVIEGYGVEKYAHNKQH